MGVSRGRGDRLRDRLPRRVHVLLARIRARLRGPARELGAALGRQRIALEKWVLFRPSRHSPRVNIGGGRWYVRGWTNVDLYAPWPYVDERIDLRDGRTLPFATGSCPLVYCTHVLQHLPDTAIRQVLREIARMLHPDGTVRIAVPDLELAFAAYESGDEDFFDHGGVRCVGPTLEQKLVNYFASYRLGGYSGGPQVPPAVVQQQLATLDRYAFVSWCVAQIPAEAEYVAHENGLDVDRLSSMAADAGIRLERRQFLESEVPEFRGPEFDHWPRVALYVEGGLASPVPSTPHG